jgi:ligand-binding sensor domain-containing protein/class 3 adenylate cyclase/predicted metal-dependent HD superfamily phosphohydrolase
LKNLTTRLKILALLFMTFASHIGQATTIKFQSLTTSDGLSQSSVKTILQDRNGFMWFGTQNGLNKYDGYQFNNYINNLSDSNSIGGNNINQIVQFNSSLIWIATDKGISSYSPHTLKFENYTLEAEKQIEAMSIIEIDSMHLMIITANQIYTLDLSTSIFSSFWKTESHQINGAEIFNSTIYIATNKGVVQSKLSGESNFSNVLGVPDQENAVGFKQYKQVLYVYTSTGIYNLNEKLFFSLYRDFSKEFQESNAEISVVHIDRKASMWIGTKNSGLFRYNLKTSKLERSTHSSNMSTSVSSNTILSLTTDKTGILWVGTRFGINKFDNERQNFNHYQIIAGNEKIDNSKVWTIYSQELPIVWIGGDNGLSKYNIETNEINTYQPKLNRSTQGYGIFAIAPAIDGFWVGTEDGFKKFDTLNKVFIDYPHSKNTSRTYSIKVMENGDVFIGSRQGLLRLNSFGKLEHFLDKSEGIKDPVKANIVRNITTIKGDTLWLGTEEGVVSFHTLRIKPYRYRISKPQIKDDFITTLWIEKDELWIGNPSAGLYSYNLKTRLITNISENEGLSNNAINSIIGDDNNNLWISTNKGLSRYNIKSGLVTNFSETDGLQNNEFNSGAGFKSANSELFFGGIDGFNVFTPNQIAINRNPPEIVITGFNLFNQKVPITTDGILKQSISQTKHIDLDYDQKVIAFEFASLHYSNPKKNKHAYMLEGFDADWVYIDNSRVATYTNLNAKTYTFKVKGSNSDNIWSEPVKITLTIHPPIWETWWFRSLVILTVLGLIFFYYRSRLIRVKQQKKLLEAQVKHRTIEIIKQKEEVEVQKKLVEEEKEKTEKLLLNVLPKETAEELKNRGRSKARNYKRATVMFTDFAGFTQIAESYKPQDLVAKLDSFFIKFDEITAQFDVEKIKTVGDAYLCVGGVPIRNKSNPIDTVLAALNIKKCMQEEAVKMEAKGEEPWELRIGIHTGDIIAGVVGIKRFAYDIWGDTVNIASRLETACEVGMINISGTTYEAVAEFFECEYRGKIPAKNKGEIDMYYVHGVKPELSENEDGITPNEAFEHYVNLKLYSNINYRNAEKYIIKRLGDELPEGLYYHGIHHTKDVCESVERLAIWEGVRGEELYLLKTAALFHDAGFIESYESNEPIGGQMAKEMLPSFGYTEEQIDLVITLIEATKVPHNPKSHLEEMMCDADLDYLGRNDFYPKAETLKQELMKFGKLKSPEDWDHLQVKFLTMHKYFTESSMKRRDPEKQKRIIELKEVLKKYENND